MLLAFTSASHAQSANSVLADWLQEADLSADLPKRVEHQILRLQDDSFLERELAVHTLLQIGPEARPELRHIQPTSSDLAIRLRWILSAIDRTPVQTPLGFPAALEDALENDAPTLVSELIRLLRHPNAHLRFRVAHALRHRTGQDFQFSSFSPGKNREVAIKRWHQWMSETPPPDQKHPRSSMGKTGLLLNDYAREQLIAINPWHANEPEVWTWRTPGRVAGLHADTNGFWLSLFEDMSLHRYDHSFQRTWSWFLPDEENGQIFDISPHKNGLLLSLGYTQQNAALLISPKGEILRSIQRPDPESKTDLVVPRAFMLEDGQILIPDELENKILSFGPNNKSRLLLNTPSPRRLRRLPNGNLLFSNECCLIEMTTSGTILHEQQLPTIAFDAIRLPNGQTAVLLKDQGLVLTDIDGNQTRLQPEITHFPYGSMSHAPPAAMRFK